MVANLVNRRHRVLIGTDQQDWSAYYGAVEVGYSSLDDGGLIEVTGSLTLLNLVGVPESLDPRQNPSRWRPGQPVYLQVRNDADTGWIDPFYARLIITEEPASPADERLTLELGCKLFWADLFELDDEQSGVVFGQAETADVIAARLLQTSEVAAGDIALSTWPYSIDYPFGKEGGGSFAAQAGELAWSNDARYLYQDAAGQVRDRQLSLTSAGSAIATVTVGTNEAVWTPLQSPEQPAELTKAVGVGYELSSLTNPEVTVDTVSDDFDNYDPSAGGFGTVHRTTTTEGYSEGDPDNTPAPIAPTKTRRVETEELEHTIYQNPSILQLVDYQTREIVKTYEAGLADPTKAKLLQIVETLEQNERSILPNGIATNDRLIYRKTTTFTHGADELITGVQVIEEQAEIILDELSTNPWNLQTTRDEDLTWTDVGAGQLRKREKIRTALIVENSDFDRNRQNPWALRTRTRTFSPSKTNTPPATEFFDAGTTQEEQHYEGTASYTHRGGSTGRNRQRLFTVPFGFSDAQMAGLAVIYRDLMIGRHLGDQIELPITDALLTAPPLPEVWVRYQGETYRYLADALSFEFGNRRASASCVGIWLEGGYATDDRFNGTVSGPAPTVTGQMTADAVSITGSVSGPAPTVSGVVIPEAGTFNGAVTGPAPTVSGSLTADPVELTGSVTGPAPTVSGAIGTDSPEFSGSVNGPAPAVSGSIDTPPAVVSGSVLGPAPTVDGQIDTDPVVLSGSISAPAPTVAGTLTEIPVISGAVAGPAPTVSGEIVEAQTNLTALTITELTELTNAELTALEI